MSSVLSFYTGGNVRETRAAKATAVRDLEAIHEKKLRDAVRELKGIKVRALRFEKRKAIKEMRAEHKRNIAETRERFDKRIADLLAQASEITSRINSSRGARRTARAKKGRVTGAEVRQEIDEAVENEIKHWRPELVPIWRARKVGFANRPRMSRFEAFQQWVHENTEAVAAMVVQQGELATEIDYACADAKEVAARGDGKASEEAAAWHVENCGRPVAAVSKKPKGSAASRTKSLGLDGVDPQKAEDAAPKAPKAPKKKGPKKTPKGQEELTRGTMKARRLVDDDDNIPF